MNNATTKPQSARNGVGCDAIVRARWNDYAVWRRQWADNTAPTPWMVTSHSLKARTSDEAQTKLRRMFSGCGFHSMSLVAVMAGENPNAAYQPRPSNTDSFSI